PAASVSVTYANFTLGSSEQHSTFECSIDGGTFLACGSRPTFTGLSAGAHTLDARAVDSVGNVDPTPAHWTWTVAAVAPANDSFSAAPALYPYLGGLSGDTTFASREAGEPSPAGGSAGRSVWFTWTA